MFGHVRDPFADLLSDSTGLRARVPDHVVHRTFEEETLVLNLDTGQYHGLNETGARFLELLMKSDGDVTAAAAALAAEYELEPAEIEGEMRTFLDELAERGLVELDGTG